MQASHGSSVVAIHCKRENDYQEDFKKTGRNTFAFWVLIIMLFALTLANLALTMTIIGVLRFGRGMEYMELVPEANSVKFWDVDLDRIQKRDGILEGFADVPMTIEGDGGGSVEFNLVYWNGHVHNKFNMTQRGTHFKNIAHFQMRNPTTKEVFFSSTKPTYNIVESTKNLKSNGITASRITSSLKDSLLLQTRGKMEISGAEGVTLDAKRHLWTADQNVQLKSINASLILSATKGIYLNPDRMPLVDMENGVRLGELQYKICACMPHAKLFRIPIPRGIHASKITCNHYDPETFSPCE